MHRTARILALSLCALALAASAFAQPILQIKGRDARVDYQSLTKFGPWDDRNYELTQDDLKLFADNEDELRIAIPAWYRVELRKGIPDMLRKGPAQYPHSALPAYRLEYGGYLVEGKIYRNVEHRQGRYHVLMENGIDRKAWEAEKAELNEKFLSGEVRVTSPNGAAESAIKINPTNTNIVIAGSNGPGSGQIMHYSSDGGDTWSQSAALPGGGTCCDPTVDYSADGTLAYTSALGNCGGSGCQIWFYRSSDNGQTWTDLSGSPQRRTLNTGSGNDKEFLHVDKYATSPFKDNIYATWHASNIMQFSVSSDFGNTWSTQAFSSATDQRGIGSDITTDKSGAVYYIWPAFNSQRILLAKSTNGGSSFGAVTEIASTESSFTFPVPSMETRDVFVYASADTDFSNGTYGDSIYVAWSDSTGPTGTASNNHARIQVAYSRNGGSTWTITTPHETADANNVDRYHQWLAVDQNGRVHIMFYDTRRSASRTAVDVYYSYSDDGAQTWTTPSRVTAEQSPNIGDSFEFGDYNGLDAVMSDVIAIYTDNRNEGGGGGDSVDVYAAGLQSGTSNAVPVVTITSPSNGSSADVGTSVSFAGTATDAEDGNLTASLAWSSSIDGSIGSGGSFSTSSLSLGSHTITASVTDSGSQTGSSSITLTIIDPNGGGPQDAAYDAGLGAPACAIVGSSCDSGSLLDGRANLGPETNQPNTLDSCTDGTSGSYHSDESNDRIVVSTLGGGNFAEGATVEISATVWAWSTGTSDTLDLYYAADANSPSWVYITSIQPPAGGAQTLTAQYTLPAGSLQAVRANFRYQGSASSCSTGSYDDTDDLVFAVGGGTPECTVNADCDNDLFCDGAETCNAGSCQAGSNPCAVGETCDEVGDVCVPGSSCAVDDDFESGTAGWINDAASTCTTGDYVTGNPTVIVNSGVTTQIGGSHSGVNSIFTATNTSAGSNDVDGGNCILGSPTWAVGSTSTLSVWYWHGQRDAGDDASGDFFLLEYSTNGGSSWNTMASRGDVTSNAVWTEATASIPAGSNVRVRVQCSDGSGPGDLVECGIDDVSICN